MHHGRHARKISDTTGLVWDRSVRYGPRVSPPRQRLATLILGRDVLEFIADHRDAGKTWPEVRDLLQSATDGEIDVTYQALQQWMSQPTAKGGAA